MSSKEVGLWPSSSYTPITLSGSPFPFASSPLKMAATFATPSTVVALVGSTSSLNVPRASGGRFTCFERNWLRTDFNVIGFGLIGWIAPSSIPAIDGKSLTGLFFESIGAELAHFPTPPALTSQFWLWLVTWHLGLFICLTFGQIGFKGRTEDYF
ncbi:photosystem I subunit O [Senna tora]|uniref:Photosystem I subunit O n=1 Tax=Senna tora TaxID=362788 RepID=A0A834SK05_9FABA|nr:photosystem I subunit O [Senna tora]